MIELSLNLYWRGLHQRPSSEPRTNSIRHRDAISPAFPSLVFPLLFIFIFIFFYSSFFFLPFFPSFDSIGRDAASSSSLPPPPSAVCVFLSFHFCRFKEEWKGAT
jgi:hypothetical protein